MDRKFFNNVYEKYKLKVSSPVFAVVFATLLYFLADVDIYISGRIIGAVFIFPFIILAIRDYLIKKKQTVTFEVLKREFSVIGIITEDGNFVINSAYKFTNNSSNKEIEYIEISPSKTLFQEIETGAPNLVISNIPGRKVIQRFAYLTNDFIPLNGQNQRIKVLHRALMLKPPLKGKDEYVKFEITDIYKDPNRTVFDEDEGNVYGVLIDYYTNSVKMTISAPVGYKLQKLEYWVQDKFRNVNPALSKGNGPKLADHDTKLMWTINHPALNHYYLFKYKLIIP